MTLSVLGIASARTGSFLGMPSPRLFGAPVADVHASREADVPPELQLTTAQSYVTRMDQSSAVVRNQLEQARAARDVVKTLCLNDKLNQVDVASRTAKDRLSILQAAVQGKDKDRAHHEFVILQSVKDRVDQVVKEANQCIGEEAGFIGDSHVTLQVDPNIPNNNPDQLGADTDIISEPPVISSPTM